MFKKCILFTAAIGLVALTIPALAGVDASILKKVKASEANFRDMKADMVITNPDKENVQGMGDGYGDILKLQKATVSFVKPDKIRFDGYAKGIKVVYVQNGYTKLILAAMIKHKKNVKNQPGQRQDSLDLGFLSSKLWTDNKVSVARTESNGIVKLVLKPKFGDKDKRHDNIWVDPRTLKVLKREKYLGNGTMRVKYTYGEFVDVGKGLPIATRLTMFDPKGGDLGTISYKNMKINNGISSALFSLNQK